MTGIKLIAIAAATESAFFINGLDVSSLSKLGTIGILILAVVALYRDAGKRMDKVEAVLDKNAVAFKGVQDALMVNAAEMREVGKAIERCKK